MKALVLEEYNRLTYKEMPDPQVGPDDVLIRVKAAGICGSDVHGLDGSTGRRIPPLIWGTRPRGLSRMRVQMPGRPNRVSASHSILRFIVVYAFTAAGALSICATSAACWA